MHFAGNGTGDTRWKVPVLDWGSMIYNPRGRYHLRKD